MRRYTHTSIFSHFPVELVDEIAYYSGVHELKKLCLVSKQTGNVATRRLYDTIVLRDARRAVICFTTLATRQDVATCVRRVAIEIPKSHRLFRGFSRLAAAALKRAINLKALSMTGVDSLLELLIDIPFPRLVEIKVPYARPAIHFLQSHRHTLKAIIVQSPNFTVHQHDPTFYFRNVEMPELLTFVGPCAVVPFVIPKSQVSHLTVCWDIECKRPEEIVRRIAESRRGIVGMDNLIVGWNPALLGIIAAHLPKMEELRIRNACSFVTTEVIEKYLLYLEEGLKKFECLSALTISMLYNQSSCQLSHLDREHDFVQQCGSFLPTLTFCTLLSETRWKRFKKNYWIPIVDLTGDGLRSIEGRWILQALTAGNYPKDSVPEILKEIGLNSLQGLISERRGGEVESGNDEASEDEEDGECEGEGEDEDADWNETGSESDVGSDWVNEDGIVGT